MTLRNIIDNLLNEGIAENIIINYVDHGDLQNSLNLAKRLLKNPNTRKEFLFQYDTLEKYLERSFNMYNKKMSQGFERDNTDFSFDKYIKPYLISFYKSL